MKYSHFMQGVLLSAVVVMAVSSRSFAAASTQPGDRLDSAARLSVSSSAESPAASASSTAALGTAFVQVAAGNYYSVGLRADGSVWTWGRNLLGELGIPDTTAVSSMAAPVRLNTLPPLNSIATDGYGYQLGVARDGTVWEWGSRPGYVRETQVPRALPGLSGISQVTTLQKYSFGLGSDGSVKAWMKDQKSGDSSQPISVSGLKNIVQLQSASDYIYALDSAGSVWRLTVNTSENQLHLSIPVRIQGLPALKQISMQPAYDAYGVDSSGKVWKWSIPASSSTGKLYVKPVNIQPSLQVRNVYASPGYALLVSRQGEVWMHDGKTGRSAVKVKRLQRIVSASAGDTHRLAIDAKGQVYGWGANNWNEVGVPRNAGDGMEYAPVPIQRPITIRINGSLLPASFPAVIKNNSIIVPVKSIAKELGGSLEATTTQEGTTYRLQYSQTTVTFRPGSAEAAIQGRSMALSGPVSMINGAVMVPASLFKQLGCQVDWNPSLAELSIQGK
ncbi:stalk domain-containing protein [Paenibacillus favisporus]|uniref:stalk domain-containing protein n=1 Tax=Paenibacillus favisporus TaxID=221028 RepID=UPI0013D47A77|nr:stalk domain-containing protein [Paenibacillus favisporus]